MIILYLHVKPLFIESQQVIYLYKSVAVLFLLFIIFLRIGPCLQFSRSNVELEGWLQGTFDIVIEEQLLVSDDSSSVALISVMLCGVASEGCKQQTPISVYLVLLLRR